MKGFSMFSRGISIFLVICIIVVSNVGCSRKNGKSTVDSSNSSSVSTTSSDESSDTTKNSSDATSTTGTQGSSKATSVLSSNRGTTKPITTTIDYGDVKAETYAPTVTTNMYGTLTVDTGTVVNKSIIGGGVNFGYSDYIYINLDTAHEWPSRSQHIPFYYGYEDIEEFLWDDYFKMIDFSGMQYVRLGVSYNMWEPINDNNDSNVTDFDKGFIFSPKFSSRADAANVPKNTYLYWKSFIKLLDYFEKKGIYVVLANWWGGASTPGFGPNNTGSWLSDGKVHNDNFGFYVSDVNEFAETFAAAMYYLKVTKGYKCVKGFSVYNETENFDNYEATMIGVYNKCGAQLTRLGIRDKVLIQAFDGAMLWNKETGLGTAPVQRIIDQCGNNMDIFALHDYNSCIDAAYPNGYISHGSITSWLINTLVKPAVAIAGNRPVIVGELGTFSYLAEHDASQKDYRLPVFNAEATTAIFNAGAKAVAYWTYNNYAHTYYTMLGFDSENKYKIIPDSTNYYPTALMMKYLPKESNIVKSTMAGCADSKAQRVFATVGVKSGNTTILLVNDSDKPAKVTIKGVNTSKKYYYQYVAEGKTDRIYPGGTLNLSSAGNIAIRPNSIVVLTTYTYGMQTVR